MHDFEFLVAHGEHEWVPSSRRPPMELCVWASDRMVVVCGTQGDRDIGKFITDEGTAKLPLHGREKQVGEYDFLVVHPPPSTATSSRGTSLSAVEAAREALAQRQEKIESLASGSERMNDEAASFHDQARQLRQAMEKQNSWLPF